MSPGWSRPCRLVLTMYPSQPALNYVRPQRILLVGRVVDLFRDVLYLARDVRPFWFFEVASSAEAAARTLDDHEVDAVIAGISREGGLVLKDAVEDHPEVRRVAVVAVQRLPPEDRLRHHAAIDVNATVEEQLAMLDRVLTPTPLRQSA